MSKVFTVATRGGALAIAQTKRVIAVLKNKYPDIKVEIKTITTKGDRDRRTALWDLKDSGFFTSLVEDALLSGQADLAVHSFKDLPTRQRQGLTITAVCDKQFAEDCLIAAEPIDSIEQLKHSAKIGTSSLRRAALLRNLRADLQPVPIRGNVITRIKKLQYGMVDAVVLARAGVERLELGKKISFCFKPEEFIPAPAQGALAVQTGSDDAATAKIIAAIDDKNARITSLAERQVLVTMQCGCHAPVGAFAEISEENIKITAFISDLKGKNFIRRQITGPSRKSNQLADKLAGELLNVGGKDILQNI